MAKVDWDKFRKEDGSPDWTGIHRAEVLNGDRCYRCDRMATVWGGGGKKSLCSQCIEMRDNKDEVRDEKYVRCPHCGHSWDICKGADDFYFCEEGCHGIYCGECDREFEISTMVTFKFKSPARKFDGDSDDRNDSCD